ncbi:MAG: glycosyltransferase [Bacilli bacterium]
MKDLISIVVPIRNVESFINVCLDSLVKQTYENIEILLIHDNTTDNTIKICEYYKKKDKRIKIIIKKTKSIENKKNIAIDNAKGKYITFVEAGDKITPTFIKDLYTMIFTYKADIVCTNYYKQNEKPTQRKNTVQVLKGITIIENYLHMNIRSHSYAKMFKKTIFDEIKFPDYEIYDDFVTMYKLFHSAKIVIYSELKKYCLIEEKNQEVSDSDCMRKINACIDMLNFIETNYPKLLDYCKTKICCEAIDLFTKVEDKEYKKQLYEYIKLYRKYAIKDLRLTQKMRLKVSKSLFGYNILNFNMKLEK